MLWFSVNNDAVFLFGNGFTPVPNFFNKRAGGIIFLRLNSDFFQFFFYLKGGAKGRNNYYIFSIQFAKGDQLFVISILQENNAMRLEIRIDVRIMDHFT